MIGENFHQLDEEKYLFGLGAIEFFGALSDSICTIPDRNFAKPGMMFFLFTIYSTYEN